MSRGRVEVVGAGIGGLTAAAALAQRGWSVRVHEKAEDLRTFGAGIYLWNNGLRVLRAVGAYEEAMAGAHVGPVFETHDCHGELMETIPINGDESTRLVTILREALLQALVSACVRSGVEIVTSSKAVGATPAGLLQFEDGSSAQADLVVASDGVHSRIRDSLDLLAYRKPLGYGAMRMLIPRADHTVPARDRLKYIEHFSGSRRILYTPASSEHLYVALCCGEHDDEARRMPIDVPLWQASFPHLSALVAQLPEVCRWDVFETIKLKSWSRGLVAILGDAAHAMPPYLGQGGGCALMNALSLAVAVSEASDASQLEPALQGWELKERPLTEHTQDTAESLGLMNEWPDELRSHLLRIMGESPYLAQQRMRTAQHLPTGT